MVDSVNSGYKAAAQTVTWTANGIDSTLTDNEWTDLSNEIDNSLNNFLFADIEVYLASVVFPDATDNTVAVYLVPSVDDTNYPDWTGNVTTDEVENEQYFIGSVSLPQNATTTTRQILRNVSLPAGKFKLGLRNKAGVSLAATGNSLKWRPWQYASS